ncbi:MAG TPA: pyridoxal-dependent decarboxylase, partial [Myxococcaceae bacterium]|nr:pyridoxal-dependent decarboxylase [Myxococcaceae bacterium]
MNNENPNRNRLTRTHTAPAEFRALGHHLVDQLGDFLESLPEREVRAERSAHRIKELLDADPFPAQGIPPREAFDRAVGLLREHAVSTAHPRFWAYIMGAASPLGALADLLASTINPPVTSYPTCALTVAMEAQTVRWVAELLGYPTDCGGLFLNGGSMANLVALRAALQARAGWDVRARGLTGTE